MIAQESMSFLLGTDTAGPMIYVVGGAILAIFTGILAINYRGLGEKYIQLTMRRYRMSSEASARTIRLFRIIYGIGSIVGVAMFISGIART